MKILFVSTTDLQGGAAIAATRLLQAMRLAGHDVSMAVRTRLGNERSTICVGSRNANKMRFFWERGIIFLHNQLSRKNLFDISIANRGVSITSLPAYKEADVIHLHWINQGMLSLKEIETVLTSRKKVVWTMHDMWPLTGICHHAGRCDAYTTGCGQCPYLKRPSPQDLSQRIFQQKQAVYSAGKITFVACSRWLESLASMSLLTQGHRLLSIPNPIDTDIYRPMDQRDIRVKLNLPFDKKIVLFAAVRASDERKGMKYLMEASRLLNNQSQDLLFLIAGSQGEEIAQQLALPAISTGYISPHQMPEFYNAADLFVTPSLFENLPNTIMEAMACGTPCVGFEIGGIPEMIDHHINGYVAKYKDADDLARGISWTLREENHAFLSDNARKKVMDTYNQETVAKQYNNIYEYDCRQ